MLSKKPICWFGPIDAQPERSPRRRLARRGPNEPTETDRSCHEGLRRDDLHHRREAVDACTRRDGPARPLGPVWTCHARVSDAGPKVAPRDQLIVRASRRGGRREFSADFDAWPEGAEQPQQRRLECTPIPSAADLLHAMNGEAVPVQAGGSVTRIEVAHHPIQARECHGIVDSLLGGLPRQRRRSPEGGQQKPNQQMSHGGWVSGGT